MSSKFSGILAQARTRQKDNVENEQVEVSPETNSADFTPKNVIEKQTTRSLQLDRKASVKPKRAQKAVAPHPAKQNQEPLTVDNTSVVEKQVARRGRPHGKRSNPNYTQITAYLTKQTHKNVKMALIEQGDRQEISELIEECLKEWLIKKR